MLMEFDDNKVKKIEQLARHVLGLSRDTLFLNLRFMDSAVSRLVPAPYEGSIGTDTSHLYFDGAWVLKLFQENSLRITRIYLHTVLHCVFQHPYVNSTVRLNVWDLACDIAVEQMLRELGLTCLDTTCEEMQDAVLDSLNGKLNLLTAEKIYHYFCETNISDEQCEKLRELFCMDDHTPWYAPVGNYGGGSGDGDDDGDGGGSYRSAPNGGGGGNSEAPDGSGDGEEDSGGGGYSDQAMSPQEARHTWQKLSQQIQVDLETFSKQHGKNAGHLMQNLKALHRERYDYAEFLRKFSVYGEVMHIDEDTFDYNFYSYGMQLYGNMPLIEPLEYKDVRRVREFVIAIDTSGSVQGAAVQKFVQKTYNILKQQESFFSKVNIHIIQCDAAIQEDAKITSQEEFDEYLAGMKLAGFGGTDFRPVFGYVNELIKKKEFTNLKGLIYFTDGYGTFPELPPPFKTAFVFLDDEMNNYNTPVWAMRLILETRDIMEE